MPSGLLLMFTTSQKYNQAMRRVGWPARCALCLFLLSLPIINLKHPSSNSATGFYKAGLLADSQKAILRRLEPLYSVPGTLVSLAKIPVVLSALHLPPWSPPGLLHGH